MKGGTEGSERMIEGVTRALCLFTTLSQLEGAKHVATTNGSTQLYLKHQLLTQGSCGNPIHQCYCPGTSVTTEALETQDPPPQQRL